MNILKKKLEACIQYEKRMYSNYMFNSTVRYILSRVKREPVRMILEFLIISRKCDYYKKKNGLITKILYLIYVSRKNRLGEKLNLEIGTENIEPGLLIYHYGVVINSDTIIGKNCRLHGDNCIGNNGKSNECPKIGDNVSLGVGAKIIGNVIIANNIKIAAGSVVVHSFLEEGITIGGIPAKKLK
ncbi:serine O-acetyltransferase [Siphonobacter sp. SORGH_AS_1065]|uniref:serine O-acetyltransferase n=1 Tax=Siphonobacter sp. SORGH_AS_1065 TaxID=3041795 RepID=UPI00277DEDA3|nr:poly-gamma-glutamate biosynthesis protein [Siphonobacter sp. SORGH_AS_1065]MDQ1086635.1 serine O-acetyltransferase [Siphonobacter sp. SORGH_AS_1065]